MATLVLTGRVDAAACVPAIGVTLDAGPRYAVRALEEAFGLPRLPVPMKIGGGGGGPVNARELVVLAAVLRAVAALAPAKLETTGEVVHGGTRTVAQVRAPAPGA